MPTTVVVTFNQALDPATAQDAQDYTIIGPHGRIVRVKSAVYDASTDSVTLHPAQRIDIHYRYELIIDGMSPNGLENTYSQLLDGSASGQPGSDYRAPLTWRNLVIDPAASKPKASHKTKTTTGSVKVKSDPVVRTASHKAAPFARSRDFRQ